MNAKEKHALQDMKKRFANYPPGFYCYICGEPIDDGRLCKKHEKYFDTTGVQKNKEYVFLSSSGISIKAVHDCV